MQTPSTTEAPFAGCVGLAELLVAFSAQYGPDFVPDLIEQLDSDKHTLRKAVEELKKGGSAFAELITLVRGMIKVTKRKEPTWMTEDKRRDRERYVLMVRAHRKACGRDMDAPIGPARKWKY